MNVDVLLITETWIRDNEPEAVKLDFASAGFSILHVHRGNGKDEGLKNYEWRGEWIGTDLPPYNSGCLYSSVHCHLTGNQQHHSNYS